uniref:Uncharacterized protein n=1 Tax=Panagrolaimus sp. PS1159 TaxID=55785 RepID=A0AC35GM75_9BILA
MSNVKNENSPSRKRGRMTFLTKDDLRLQVGEDRDKRARAFQLLQKAEECIKTEAQKNRELEARLQKAEENNVTLIESVKTLAKEIKNIREKHENQLKEKDEIYKEWVKIHSAECQAKIDEEKVKSDIEKAKWLAEIQKMLENEYAKKNANVSTAETQTPFETSDLSSTNITSNDDTLDEDTILPQINTSDPSIEAPAVITSTTTSPSTNTITIPENLQERISQIRSIFKNLPIETQTKMKTVADHLVLLIQRGKKIQQPNCFVALLIANRLNPHSFNIEH